MHHEARAFVQAKVAELGPFDTVVEFGSRNINGGVRDLFGPARYLGVDIAPGDGVDVVCDAATWRTEAPADCVVCCEVLEHAPNPRALIDSAFCALRQGGILIVTAACDPRAPHSAADGGAELGGEWYRNIHPGELGGWLSEWQWHQIAVDPVRGDVYATAGR